MGFWGDFKQNMHVAKEERQCSYFLQQILKMLEDEPYASFSPVEGAEFYKELKIAYVNYTYRMKEYNITSIIIKGTVYDFETYETILQAKMKNICRKYGIIDEIFKH